MSYKIKHSGVVEAVERDRLRVRILQADACAGCKAAAHCHASESKEKVVDVYGVISPERYSVGQTVDVSASTQVGMNAVLLAFGVPFLILVVALFGLHALGVGEGASALLSLACLVPYYIILYMCRDRLREKFTFRVED